MMGQMYNILNEVGLMYQLDEIGVKMLLSYGFMLEDYTLCKEVKKIKPGEYITYEKRCIEVKQYYRLNNECNYLIPEDEAIDILDKLFRQAVKRQFEKDEEYQYDHIVALSAGLDCRMTSFVAHDLGYTTQTNITFSQSEYYDDYVSKKMATDLGHDWIFKSLDYGNWLLDVDEVNRTTGGNVLYYGTAHGNSLFKRINFAEFGLIHSGQVGDVVFSTHSKIDNEPYIIGDGAYSNSYISQLSPYLKDTYPNQEIGLWYCRYLNGTNNGQQNEYNYTETLSPFMDLDLIEFALTIPSGIRFDHNLYKKWIIKKYPKAAEYIWTGLGDKITAPKLKFRGTTYSRKVFLRKLIQLILVQKSSYYNSKFNMNPIGYYINQNPKLKDSIYNHHQYIDLIANEDIKSEIKEIIIKGKPIELIQVHTLMSALKLFFNV